MSAICCVFSLLCLHALTLQYRLLLKAVLFMELLQYIIL